MGPDAGHAVCVVFICAAGSVSGRLVDTWVRTGQSLAAVVISETRPGKPLPRPFVRLARSGVPVVRALNSVNTALGFESGIVIVVVAIILDRVLSLERSK